MFENHENSLNRRQMMVRVAGGVGDCRGEARLCTVVDLRESALKGPLLRETFSSCPSG